LPSTKDTWLSQPGLVDIVGTVDGTQVTVTPTGAIQAGGGLSTLGGTVTLNRGDVLQVASALDASPGAYGSDLSGSLIQATEPIVVIAGHDAAAVPSASTLFADHLEGSMLPLERLGKEYVVSLPVNYNFPLGVRQVVQIVGTVDGTVLAYDPVPAGAPSVLNAGGIIRFETTTDLHVSANEAVLVTQYLEGQDVARKGDPAEALVVPVGGFREGYAFFTPPAFEEHWLSIVAPTGATVTVDGSVVTGFTPVGSSGYSAARVRLNDNENLHRATGTAPFGALVHGYARDTSYMYPAGVGQ
jgi:hypothetical protein